MSAATINTLRAAMALLEDLGPPPIMAICDLFPTDRATTWSCGRQEYCVAGRAFFDKLPQAIPAVPIGQTFNLGAIPVRDLDHPANAVLRGEVLASFGRAKARTPTDG